MNREDNREFIRKVETLVQPEDVNTISFLGDANKLMPLSVQRAIVKKGSPRAPYMGFIVDPYCFFLTYEITDTEAALSCLPPGYELVPVKMFEDEKEEKNLLVIGTFSARTSAFTGVRSEFYLIARNKKTGISAWIIIDYETNTNTYDPGHGFSGYSLKDSLFTTSPYGELLLQLNSRKKGEILTVRADIKEAPLKKLAEPLWFDHNYHTDYGRGLSGPGESLFSLAFDPANMKEALWIDPDKIVIDSMKIFNNFIDDSKPVSSLCFPYAQHYFINSQLARTHKNQSDMEKTVLEFIGIKQVPKMKGDQIKKPLLRGILIAAVINTGIIAGLVLALLL